MMVNEVKFVNSTLILFDSVNLATVCSNLDAQGCPLGKAAT